MSRVSAFKHAADEQLVIDTARWNVAVESNRVAALSAVERPVTPRVEEGRRHGDPGDDLHSQSGGCYNQPYIPAWIITRESRGDPTIINGGGHAASPYLSGGRSWGCFQFMPGTWNGSCSDLGFDVASQIECARRVSAGGTNLSPWRL